MPLANKGGPNYTPGRLFWAVEIVTVPAQTLIRLIALLLRCSVIELIQSIGGYSSLFTLHYKQSYLLA